MNRPVYDPRFYRLEFEPVESPFPFHETNDLFLTREDAEEEARGQGCDWIEVRLREHRADAEAEEVDFCGKVVDYRYLKVRPEPAKQAEVNPTTAEAVAA